MDEFLNRIWEKKWLFFSTFFIVFTLSYLLLLAFDFLPEPPAEQGNGVTDETMQENQENSDRESIATTTGEAPAVEESNVIDQTAESVQAVLPTTISIVKFGKTVPVLNPTSRTIADLDTALLSGVVRHPDSATLGQDGNVFLLGHSSYLPQVFNKNFQAFNGIQNLEWGDLIEVSSDKVVYEYRVEKVYRARAQDLTVPIAGTGKMLTLATCNSFGSVDDRYIVEAKQTGERKL